MLSMELTKDADKFLCVLYKEYLQRRKNGQPKNSSKEFNDQELEKLFPDERSEDLMEYAAELQRAFDISIDILGGISLSDESLIFMENRFPNGIASVFDWMAKIKNAVPFV